ncbi:unnamed protein product [Triticum turgidum subsp. durum]|uniref:Uncharacterized protein n=1 Tax=Triticum turgidum subsp. durum TaxID=4567 RepID=A0A9R0R5P8_TRITD|nr:unnamed protein product [Triticum turgidum subsp. durum]
MDLVPPVSDYPSPTAARTRMSVPGYDVMFGKLSLRGLFDDYFMQRGGIDTRFVLKAKEDPRLQLAATISTSSDMEAQFRWHRDLDNPHTFVDLTASASEPMLRLRSCAYYPKYGIGAFGTFPFLMTNRVRSEDYGVMGLRYGSRNLSIGASFLPFALSGEVPYSAWLVGRRGGLSAGVQYKPLSGSKHPVPFTDPMNWNCAISYGMGSNSPLSPSLNFALELVRNTQLVASFYRNHVVGCTEGNTEYDFISPTNSIDLGLELAKRLNRDKPPENANDLSFQIAACWKPNEHVLVKGKAGLSKSSFAMVLNHPIMTFLTFNVAVERDHKQGTGSYGFGFCFKDI